MYYPLLRGKREELLALQELLNKKCLKNTVIPVIEPVSLSSTLITTMELFRDLRRDMFIIRNPIEGNFEDDMSIANLPEDEEIDDKEKRKHEKSLENRDKFIELLSCSYIKPALYPSNEFEDTYNQVIEEGRNDIAILFNDEDEVETFKTLSLQPDAISVYFVPDINFKKSFNKDLVLFRDKFNKCVSNAVYADNTDEFFTRDHLVVADYLYSGFSDYSIIGKRYEESGFAPYAIAIHIIYPNRDTDVLRIKHFVSNTNVSNKNPALKFSEAVYKLVVWSEEYPHIQSLGLTKLKKCYEEGRYPGLGCIKRYSIMHHLEIVGNL